MDKLKIVIAGGRDFKDCKLLEEKLDLLLQNYKHSDIEIVCGCARGTDTMGEEYGKKNGIDVKYFPADWDTYGKGAGYIRNKQMAEYSNCLVAFWDGKSKGTKHMIDLANKCNLNIRIIRY